MTNLDVLKKQGLEEKEARIYLSLLKFGEAGVTLISDDTRIERTLCYSIINKLIDKGLVSYIVENNVKYFMAASPESLMKDLEEKKKELEEVMPDLISLSKNRVRKAKAEIYQGKEGIKFILKDIIKQGKDYLVFGEEGQFQKMLPIESEQFMVKIEEAGIKEKVLVKEGKKVVKSKNSRFKYVPKKYFSPSTTVVYANKVAIIVWSEPSIIILIENKEISDSYRSYFYLLWRMKFSEFLKSNKLNKSKKKRKK